MARHKRNTKGLAVGDRRLVEQSEIVDDNLLPDADEIHKLHQIDPTILEWLKSKTGKEQDFRHEFLRNQLKAAENANTKHHSTSRIALAIFFCLFLTTSASSFVLLWNGLRAEGFLSGTGSVIMALTLLVTGVYNRKNPSNKSVSDSQANTGST